MWETSWQYSSSTPLPPDVSIETGIQLLHDFDFVMRLSPDCRGSRPIPPPAPKNSEHESPSDSLSDGGAMTYYEVEDDLPFIPKCLWSGGVKYQADFTLTPDGCRITVHAPGGFTSTNQWRLQREVLPEGGEVHLERVESEDMMHADQKGSGWHVQIVSDARVNKTFAGFVKGFLKSSHQQLQNTFIEKLRGTTGDRGSGRPALSRKGSSTFSESRTASPTAHEAVSTASERETGVA